MNLKHLLFLTALFPSLAFGQQISDLVTLPGNKCEALTHNPVNNRYYTLSNGKIFKISPSGAVDTIAYGYSAPFGGAVDYDGNFYFSEYNTGKVFKVRPNDSVSLYASGMQGPCGIVMNPAGTHLYVSNYLSSTIREIDMSDSSQTTFAIGNGISGPDGLVFDGQGNLIVANWNNNLLHKVDQNGNVSYFTTVPASTNTGYIVKVGTGYYVTGFFGHRVMHVDSLGNATIVAGSGVQGHLNAGLLSSELSQPNGICTNATGDTIIVTDGIANQMGYLRSIPLTGISTSVIPEAKPQPIIELTVSPNPSDGPVEVRYALPHSAKVTFTLLDMQGRVIGSKDQGQLNQGSYQFTLQEMFDGETRPADGLFILRLDANDQTVVRRVIL